MNVLSYFPLSNQRAEIVSQITVHSCTIKESVWKHFYEQLVDTGQFHREGMFFQGKKRLRAISGLRVATAYLAKTSVIARNVGHSSWEAERPRGWTM